MLISVLLYLALGALYSTHLLARFGEWRRDPNESDRSSHEAIESLIHAAPERAFPGLSLVFLLIFSFWPVSVAYEVYEAWYRGHGWAFETSADRRRRVARVVRKHHEENLRITFVKSRVCEVPGEHGIDPMRCSGRRPREILKVAGFSIGACYPNNTAAMRMAFDTCALTDTCSGLPMWKFDDEGRLLEAIVLGRPCGEHA